MLLATERHARFRASFSNFLVVDDIGESCQQSTSPGFLSNLGDVCVARNRRKEDCFQASASSISKVQLSQQNSCQAQSDVDCFAIAICCRLSLLLTTIVRRVPNVQNARVLPHHTTPHHTSHLGSSIVLVVFAACRSFLPSDVTSESLLQAVICVQCRARVKSHSIECSESWGSRCVLRLVFKRRWGSSSRASAERPRSGRGPWHGLVRGCSCLAVCGN